MQSVKLEPRPLYAIGTVARLTGLKPDTLRVWERRYGLGASHRSNTGRRQYTQADLEHMQLVATLVNSGVRIGEIAACSRKTLEFMARGPSDDTAETDVRKPSVLVVGTALCQWLDEHQGCLANVDASLARVPLAHAADSLAGVRSPDLLLVGCETLNFAQVRQIDDLVKSVDADSTLVACGNSSERTLQTLERSGARSITFPPDPGFLAFELTRLSAELTTRAGSAHLGELVTRRPRQISGEELAAASALQLGGDDIDPARLATLVSGLAGLEDEIASSEVGDWSDAALRACAYAYAGQARWLMEKALRLLLAPQGESDRKPAPLSRAGRLHDAA